MAWLKELVRSTVPHLWALMSCAVFTLVGIWALIFQKDSQWLIQSSFILSGLFVIVAIALAWRDEHKKLLVVLAKNERPNLKLDIDCALRDPTDPNGLLFLHVHVVNLTGVSTSLRTISLRNQSTGEVLRACPFNKRSLFMNAIKTSVIGTEQDYSRKDARIKEEFTDLLGVLKSPLLRGDGKEGWIAFHTFFSLSEKENLSLSLHIEDAFGGTHESQITNIPVEMGSI